MTHINGILPRFRFSIRSIGMIIAVALWFVVAFSRADNDLRSM